MCHVCGCCPQAKTGAFIGTVASSAQQSVNDWQTMKQVNIRAHPCCRHAMPCQMHEQLRLSCAML